MGEEGFFERLRKGLSKTHAGFVSQIDRLVSGKKGIDETLLEELEEILITADLGTDTTFRLINELQQRAGRNELNDPQRVKDYIKDSILAILKTAENPVDIDSSGAKPFVIMVVGVNGVGKTTTIGKLAGKYQSGGKKTLLAASDTFRAAATEQLEVWAARIGANIVKQSRGSDPSAVAYDAVHAAKARSFDIVFVDTAGRLHTKENLMEELRKLKRIVGRECPGAPHEILLILDATTGQNAISQTRLFNEALGITGIALTKLDGTAKGGIIVGITESFHIPIRYIGVGEKMDDLREFDAEEFVAALF
ncbi:MAG: signal recognition particle-docking protein FtsY [Deltaproteobacteria bacterium]|nr:signal recognition particle-docking protein FtsY [Deltaproteobacteria bacterium]